MEIPLQKIGLGNGIEEDSASDPTRYIYHNIVTKSRTVSHNFVSGCQNHSLRRKIDKMAPQSFTCVPGSDHHTNISWDFRHLFNFFTIQKNHEPKTPVVMILGDWGSKFSLEMRQTFPVFENLRGITVFENWKGLSSPIFACTTHISDYSTASFVNRSKIRRFRLWDIHRCCRQPALASPLFHIFGFLRVVSPGCYFRDIA